MLNLLEFYCFTEGKLSDINQKSHAINEWGIFYFDLLFVKFFYVEKNNVSGS